MENQNTYGTNQRRKKRKKIKRMTMRMKKKLLLVFFVIVMVLIVLIGRIIYIQHVKGATYERIVLSQQEYDSETIPYRRGDILDAKGTILATSTDVYNLILDCKVMTSKEIYVEPTLTALFSCYPELDESEVRAIVREHPDSQYNVLIKRMSYDEMEKLNSMMSDPKNYPNIKGIWFEKNYLRSYPYGSLAAPVIGFTRSDNVGMTGLENYYDSTLSGTNGRRYGYLNSDSDLEKTVKNAKDGNTIVTTLDANLQSIVEDKIAIFARTFENKDREGAAAEHIGVVIMNPKNGEVKAMAQYPSFDLTDPWDLTAYYTQEEIDAFTEEERTDALNRIWTNFCISNTYEPGSTAKPFTEACGLETGTLIGDETYVCDGKEVIAGSPINCVNRSGHGVETLRTAIMDSCNDALMQMSYRIGVDNFCKYQNLFGFGLKTNIDLPGEARTDSLIYTPENMKTIDLATNSFGQNFNTTMIQIASAFCSLVNNGEYYQPHMVSKVLDSAGNTIRTVDPVLLKQTVSQETSETLRGFMKDTVAEGTAKYAQVSGYSIGGKTGTAQISTAAGKDKENYLVSFLGFVPTEDPELVIYCIVDKPNAAEQAHSTYAQNIVREILEEALPYLNIYPTEPVAEDALTPDQTNFYTGLSAFLTVPSEEVIRQQEEGTTEANPQEASETEGDTTPQEEGADDAQASPDEAEEENTPEGDDTDNLPV